MEQRKIKTIPEVFKKLRGATPQERLLHRLHSVALVLHGYSASEAARIYMDSPRAVAYWVTRFKKMGMKGLESEPRPGRPSTLNVVQLKKLRAFVKKQKETRQGISVKALSQFVKKSFGIELTERHYFRLLKKLKT